MKIDPSWHFEKNSPHEYELVLEDLDIPSSGFIFRTGYISSKLRDILHAEWYLSGSACHVELTDRQKRILEDIRFVSQKHLAAFTDQES